MKDNIPLDIIATVKSDFTGKFGIPRQSGLVPELKSRIVFLPRFRNPEALRGIEEYSHLWVLWKFSENRSHKYCATVRPPRLGGNKRVGVFATRSPFRPNPIGLSCVKLERVIKTEDSGTVLEISGADMLDGTPVYDIKPYIPYADCRPDAAGGFSSEVYGDRLEVIMPDSIACELGADICEPLKKILAGDPRPAYQNDPQRIYSFEFSKRRIKFRVEENRLYVISADPV